MWMLLGFLLAWVGFAIYGRKKKWSGVISIGGGFIFAAVAFPAIIMVNYHTFDIGGFRARDEAAQAAAQKAEEQRLAEEQKRKDAECRKDISCWAEKHFLSATMYCTKEVPKTAQYTHEWTDKWSESKFSRYKWHNSEQGVVIYLGDKIRFQNGFGAWQNMKYACTFDTLNQKVVTVDVVPGHLPG